MVKTLPFDPLGINSGAAYKCVADIRNTGKVSKILVKFLHRILHVYIDNNEGQGYKFCLAVQLDEDYKDHHMAFTAATGQVADNHDILEITTRSAEPLRLALQTHDPHAFTKPTQRRKREAVA